MKESMREQRGEWDEFVVRRILLTVHGPEEAAAEAVKVAEATRFDLHVVHVKLLPLAPPYPEVLRWREDLEWDKRGARGLLDKQVEEIEDTGGTVAGAHLRDERPARSSRSPRRSGRT